MIAAVLITLLAVSCARETRHRDLTDIGGTASAPETSAAPPTEARTV